jgi:predicted CoA-binding protein
MPVNHELASILASTQRIALVGASPDPSRDSHRVMAYLLRAGFEVTPVNPTIDSVLGKKSFANLKDVPTPIDTVVCFRRSEEIEPIARDAVAIGARNLWMQLGVVNDHARQIATEGGLKVVMNRCIMVDHAQAQRTNR